MRRFTVSKSPSGTRQIIQVLSLIKPYGHSRVRGAVAEAIAVGCADAAAVQHLVKAADLTHAHDASIELDALSRFERLLPVMTDYDGLLSEEVTPSTPRAAPSKRLPLETPLHLVSNLFASTTSSKLEISGAI